MVTDEDYSPVVIGIQDSSLCQQRRLPIQAPRPSHAQHMLHIVLLAIYELIMTCDYCVVSPRLGDYQRYYLVS